jgi:DNA-binding PadR family transcriptional regulator
MHRQFGFFHHDSDREHGHEGRHGGRHRHMRGPFGHHGPRGGHMGGHTGRRGGGGRFFDQGDLRLVILGLIAEAPSHGYQIIKTLEERTGGAYAPSPGVVYPTLTLLEEQGLIEQSGTDGAKKLYSLTEAGAEFLKTEAAAIKAITDRLQGADDRGGAFSPRLFRAQAGLKIALKQKLMQGQLSDEQVDRLVTALDAAAKAVDEA